MNKTMASLSVAVACVVAAAGMSAAQAQVGSMGANPPAELITNGPQANPGDNSGGWSAKRNVAESQQYEQLLHRNAAFRQVRIRKECGPIDNPQLHEQCVASFQGG